ncbi:MAG: LysE family transporter [Bacteroidota bacterium]|nr:LysE family transporter [Bacteroidota bacterium]
MQLAKVFFWGTIISFFGTLSPSPLNLTAMQISVHESIRIAMYFSLGTILSEIIYVRLCLVGVNWLQKQKTLFKWLEWITFALILALAIGSFIAASKAHPTQNVILDNNINRFLLGMIMSALTPMHIPFWIGWSTVLFTKKILKANNTNYYIYIAGAAVGTFLANWLYIYSGKYIVETLNTNQSLLNRLLGGVFAITALVLLVKILWHKDTADKMPGLVQPQNVEN